MSSATARKPPPSRDRAAELEAEIRDFCAFGANTRFEERDGLPYYINEFWTAGQRQAHSIHEVSYRACFKPQLPRFFIDRLSAPGEAVYDPFMGRGTTPIEAALAGRTPIGNDVNPLSPLLTRPRLDPPSLAAVAARLEEVPWGRGEIEREDLLVFYHPETLRHLCALRRFLLERAPLDGEPDAPDDWIRMVALNRLTGHSPGFFSVYTLPPNQAVSVEAQRKINEKRAQTPPPRDVARLILKKSRALLADGAPARAKAGLCVGDAAATPSIDTGSIKLVVTSPPFLDVVQYESDNWLRSWFAGIDPAEVTISAHRSEADWSAMVSAVFKELARVLAPGGHVAFEVGEVKGGKLLLEPLVWRAAEGLPFERLFVLVNEQRFTKTSHCWGVANNGKGTNSNRIVLLRRR
ncbi:DNA methyltransferase [Methylocystis bryophila]|uniref:site-specific DNA-methyltransferase (adenine-specific) n=1 Tax=Methylocystis bryophila TaxID=655015 RepID=A0A1W6MVF4_9HYPH|nr:DNA methyltransferase [Methylocystis bryophila]ARN81547.1 DNA modification methylase [Methylocystis bryophila]BDV37575.1 DNA methylase [Methylocystis bryophila]